MFCMKGGQTLLRSLQLAMSEQGGSGIKLLNQSTFLPTQTVLQVPATSLTNTIILLKIV